MVDKNIIKKILLNINYNSRKTLSENKKMIDEDKPFAGIAGGNNPTESFADCVYMDKGGKYYFYCMKTTPTVKKTDNIVSISNTFTYFTEASGEWRRRQEESRTLFSKCDKTDKFWTSPDNANNETDTYTVYKGTTFSKSVTNVCTTTNQQVQTQTQVKTGPSAQDVYSQQCALPCEKRYPYYSVVCEKEDWNKIRNEWVKEKGEQGSKTKTNTAVRKDWCSGWRPGKTNVVGGGGSTSGTTGTDIFGGGEIKMTGGEEPYTWSGQYI